MGTYQRQKGNERNQIHLVHEFNFEINLQKQVAKKGGSVTTISYFLLICFFEPTNKVEIWTNYRDTISIPSIQYSA